MDERETPTHIHSDNINVLWILFQLVLALYPQTTCFYRALIHEPPRKVIISQNTRNVVIPREIRNYKTFITYFYYHINKHKKKFITFIPVHICGFLHRTGINNSYKIYSLKFTIAYITVLLSLQPQDDYSVLFEDTSYPDGYSPPLLVAQRYVICCKEDKKKWGAQVKSIKRQWPLHTEAANQN